MNIVGMPAEIPRTFIHEAKEHPWVSPFTGSLRLVNNIFLRTTSAVNDIAFFPLIAPFTDDLSPLTEPMGMPEYPWQAREEEF